tara:strand:- start:103 stop:558 length:456 start_codon:yes stop_codon:yes gene_type:complete
MRILLLVGLLAVSVISFGDELKGCKYSGGSTSTVKVINGNQETKTTVDYPDSSLLWDVSIQKKSVIVNEYANPNSGVEFDSTVNKFHIVSRDDQAIYAIQKPDEYGLKSSGQTIFIDLAAKVVFSSVYSSANMKVVNALTGTLNHVFTCGK